MSLPDSGGHLHAQEQQKKPFPLSAQPLFLVHLSLIRVFAACCMPIILAINGGDVARGMEVLFIQLRFGNAPHPALCAVRYCTGTVSLIFYALLFVHEY